jgi:hypothetical protein
MTQRRRCTGEFQAHVVLEFLSGAKSAAELHLHRKAKRRTPTTDRSPPFPRDPHRVEQLESRRASSGLGLGHHVFPPADQGLQYAASASSKR